MTTAKQFSFADLQQVLATILIQDGRELLASNLQSVRLARQPKRATLMFRILRSSLESVIGRPLCLEELSEITGEPKSTLSDWLGGSGQPSVEAVISLIERLPLALRHQVLDLVPVSRCHPVLEHPRISHDQIALSSLKSLLRKPSGVTLVQGEREELVTFVVTAIGHSFWNLNGARETVTGIDVHFPDWFVEVPGVLYLENLQRLEAIALELEAIWDAITDGSGLIVLNGVWPQIPQLLDQIRGLGKERHVVIGCTCKLPKERVEIPGPAHLITASPDRQLSDRISVEIQPV